MHINCEKTMAHREGRLHDVYASSTWRVSALVCFVIAKLRRFAKKAKVPLIIKAGMNPADKSFQLTTTAKTMIQVA